MELPWHTEAYMYNMILVAALLFLAALFILLCFFFHGYIRRAHMAFFRPEFFPRGAASIAVIGKSPLWQKLLWWLFSAALSLLSLNVFSMSGIFLLHLAAVGALMHLVYLLCKGFLPATLRRIHFSGVLPLLLAVLVMMLGYANLHHVTPTHYTLHTDKPLRESGVRLVAISDVHYGVSLSDDDLQRVCDEIGALSPDVVLLLGDLVDNDTPRDRIPTLFSLLGGIDAGDGVYFIFGNHDRPYTQIKSEFDGDTLLAAIREAGITVLQDDTALLGDDVLLIGREDASRPRMTAAALCEQADMTRYTFMLDHQPTDYAGVRGTGVDLLLSGHTHGGQLFPLGLFMKLFHINDHVYGYTDIDADTAAIVSSGLAGWRFPLKTDAPAEYLVIDILPR